MQHQSRGGQWSLSFAAAKHPALHSISIAFDFSLALSGRKTLEHPEILSAMGDSTFHLLKAHPVGLLMHNACYEVHQSNHAKSDSVATNADYMERSRG